MVLDLYSRRVIGWAVSNRMKKDLAIRALEMAVALRKPAKGCIHHSDRGSQYCSHEYQNSQQANTFIGLPPDYLVCVSPTENTIYTVYDNAGNLLAPVGTPFRQSYVMLLRDYGGSIGWGSGIFRRVEEGKIGHVKLLTVCPPSER